MEAQNIKITAIGKITHDVLQIRTEKPSGLRFEPGQATEISINKDGWRDEKRPFTFTCLPGDNFLEFTIKTYPDRKGVTSELLNLKANDQLILHDIFGTILYQGEGVFIAGGAGVTPFISIFRYLHSRQQLGNNKLIFANKTRKDIILEQEFKNMLKGNFLNILSDEKAEGYFTGMVSKEFLKPHVQGSHQKVYVCGPPPMMDAILPQLSDLNVRKDFIVTEAF